MEAVPTMDTVRGDQVRTGCNHRLTEIIAAQGNKIKVCKPSLKIKLFQAKAPLYFNVLRYFKLNRGEASQQRKYCSKSKI